MTKGQLAKPLTRAAALYDYGRTTVFSFGDDPRLSYCLYVPPTESLSSETGIIAVVHGTGRNFARYRDAFAEFGRWNNCIVVSPLFPVGVFGEGNRDGYKHLIERDIRYDLALISMVQDVATKYGIAADRFALWGFSGGGQFANRFLLAHPDRLWAVSIGAPGSVTMIDDTRDWWVGTRDFEQRFGHPIDRDALSRVPVNMVVGAADIETWEITHKPGSRHWMKGSNDAGATRPERLQSLARNFRNAGIEVQLDIVPNMPHGEQPALPYVTEFFAARLSEIRCLKD